MIGEIRFGLIFIKSSESAFTEMFNSNCCGGVSFLVEKMFISKLALANSVISLLPPLAKILLAQSIPKF